MLSCKEVTRLTASDGIQGAAWPTRLAMRLHLVVCRHCRRYRGELRAISAAARRAAAPTADVDDVIFRIHQRVMAKLRQGSPANE